MTDRGGVRGPTDSRQFVAGDLGDQFGNQVGLGGEIAVDGAGGDIGPDRDRRDLYGSHTALGGGVSGSSQDGAAARCEAFHDLMGPPIDHAAFPVPMRLTGENPPKSAFSFLAMDDRSLQEVNNNSDVKTSRFWMQAYSAGAMAGDRAPGSRHHGPTRQPTSAATTSVAPKPVGAPSSG